tara:strand:- start:5076 stop:5408 length:333 start_codon:yes stop_codon:yes gene_type:complete
MTLTALRKKFNTLCGPAQLYAFISLLSILALAVQNGKNKKHNRYCAGNFECNLNFSKWGMVILQVLYVVFWTIVLDSLCKNGYKNVSWVLVLIPYVLFFIILALFMLGNM